jgi:hypothetical protein
MALAGESAGLVIKRAAAPCPRYAQHYSCRYDYCDIDILERIFFESRKSNGQHPFSSDIVAFGLG